MKLLIILPILFLIFSSVELYAADRLNAIPDTIKFKKIQKESELNNLKPKPLYNINIYTGIWSNKTLGTYPMMNFSIGMRRNKNNFYLSSDWILNKSVTNLYTIEYQRIVIRNPWHEFYTVTGTGAEFLAIVKAGDKAQNEKIIGLAVNAGLGYSYYFNKKHGPRIELLYHFADLKSNDGTKIDPNSIMIRMSYSFGNDYK